MMRRIYLFAYLHYAQWRRRAAEKRLARLRARLGASP